MDGFFFELVNLLGRAPDTVKHELHSSIKQLKALYKEAKMAWLLQEMWFYFMFAFINSIRVGFSVGGMLISNAIEYYILMPFHFWTAMMLTTTKI